VNYDEMDGDRLRLPANRNCYRLSRVSWALFKFLVLLCEKSERDLFTGQRENGWWVAYGSSHTLTPNIHQLCRRCRCELSITI